MKLSIIMVSYNEIEFLDKAIESCINDSLGYEYEIIIGDDGSNDGSIDLIKEYCERYQSNIKYFVMDRSDIKDTKDVIPSIRVSNILKKAFDICQGEYVTVISGDDINTRPDRYLKQIEFLDKNEQFSSCYIDYKKFWNDDSEENCRLRASVGGKIFWATQYVHVSCFVFRRDCLKNLLDRFCDDTGLIYSILVTGKSKHLNINGFGYRQRDKSIMHEADRVELSLLEIALFQDCLNHGQMKRSTLSRFYKPLHYLKANRNSIVADKYKKYICNCSKYPNDVLQLIIEDNKTIDMLDKQGCVYYHTFKILRKMDLFLKMLLSR